MSKAKKAQRHVYLSQADWERHADRCEYHEELCGPGEWHCVPGCPEKGKAQREETK